MIPAAELRAWVGGQATDDDELTLLEKAAVALIEHQTGRYFGTVDETTEYVEGKGFADLALLEPPADPEDLTSITVKEYAYVGATPTTIVASAVDGFVLRGRRLIRKHGYVWNNGYEYEITYERGYSAGNEPQDIRKLVLNAVVAAWGARGGEGLESETLGPYSYTVASEKALAALPNAEETLAVWRRWVVA